MNYSSYLTEIWGDLTCLEVPLELKPRVAEATKAVERVLDLLRW